MPFVNQTVTDADIDEYGLPFEKGRLNYWTYDSANRRYLWGGLAGNPAYEDFLEGRFYLYVDGIVYYIVIEPGFISRSLKDSPYKIEWKSIQDISPSPHNEQANRHLLNNLKEALLVYGVDGSENRFTPDREIVFGF